MIKFKLKKKVPKKNKNANYPELDNPDLDCARVILFTPAQIKKLDRLKKRFKVSRSAIIRIMLESFEIA